MASKRKKRLNAACRAGTTAQQRHVRERQLANTLRGCIFDPSLIPGSELIGVVVMPHPYHPYAALPLPRVEDDR